MSQASVVLIVPLGELGVGAGQLPIFGGAGGGHPDQGLPGGGGYPSHGLPGSPGHPAPPIALPPTVWPPRNIGGWTPGTKPTHPISPPTAGTKPVPPGSPLPEGSSLILVYNDEKGWQGAVVDSSGATKPVAPSEPK